MKAFYLEESHGSLRNNGAVGRAVKDLLGTGTTDALPQQWTSRRAAAPAQSPSQADRTAAPQEELGAAVSDREGRHLLEVIAVARASLETLNLFRLADGASLHA